jgi:regulator of CtrA degradation
MATIFFSRTFDEAMDLLIEARDYLTYREPIDRQYLDNTERLVLNCEAMRLTSRLTQVMAWLLVQKAVVAGEISREESAQEAHRLSGQSVCLTREGAEHRTIPTGLRSLLDRSYHLYTRVERLDEMAASSVH